MKSMRQIRARWYAAAGSVLAALALAATQGAAAAGAAASGPAGGNGPHWSGNLIADGNAEAGLLHPGLERGHDHPGLDRPHRQPQRHVLLDGAESATRPGRRAGLLQLRAVR